jgi:hypothetical protein
MLRDATISDNTYAAPAYTNAELTQIITELINRIEILE